MSEIKLTHKQAQSVIAHLRDYACRRRADGARETAVDLEEHADTLEHEADSNWRNCENCGWVGTHHTGRLIIECPLCGWSYADLSDAEVNDE